MIFPSPNVHVSLSTPVGIQYWSNTDVAALGDTKMNSFNELIMYNVEMDARVYVQFEFETEFNISKIVRWLHTTSSELYSRQSIEISQTGKFSGEENTVWSCESITSCGPSDQSNLDFTTFGRPQEFIPTRGKFIRFYTGGLQWTRRVYFREFQVWGHMFNIISNDPEHQSCTQKSFSHTSCPGLCINTPGYETTISGDNLRLCRHNTYNNGSSNTCYECGPHLITKEAGSESESECKCQQGYFRTDALTGNICEKCALPPMPENAPFCIQNGSILLYGSAHTHKGSRFMKNSSTYADFYGSAHTEWFHPCYLPPTTRTRSGPTDRTPPPTKICQSVRGKGSGTPPVDRRAALLY
jgi:hypothetical protein